MLYSSTLKSSWIKIVKSWKLFESLHQDVSWHHWAPPPAPLSCICSWQHSLGSSESFSSPSNVCNLPLTDLGKHFINQTSLEKFNDILPEFLRSLLKSLVAIVTSCSSESPMLWLLGTNWLRFRCWYGAGSPSMSSSSVSLFSESAAVVQTAVSVGLQCFVDCSLVCSKCTSLSSPLQSVPFKSAFAAFTQAQWKWKLMQLFYHQNHHLYWKLNI